MRIVIIKKNHFNLISEVFNDGVQFKCDFCPSSFQDEEAFNTHIVQHFERKNCLNCDKLLLRIGSNWYEIHADDTENLQNIEHQNDLIDLSAEIKTEISVDEMEIKDFQDIEANECNDEKPVMFDAICDASPSIDSSDSDEWPGQSKSKSKNKKRDAKKKKNSETEREAGNTQNISKAVRSRKTGRLPRIICRICDRLILKYKFETHLQNMHVPNVITKKQRVSCETCGKTFSNSGNLKIHQAIHTGTKRFGMIKKMHPHYL